MEKKFDKNIFKEMILYISERCKNKSDFTEDHLHKILFYADFFWYGHTGESISKETYYRKEKGQVPKHIDEVGSELVGEGLLEIVKKRCVDTVMKRPIALTGFELVKLSKEYQDFIDTIILWIASQNAPNRNGKDGLEIVLLQNVEIGEEIPYEIVFFRNKNPLSEKDIEGAQIFIDRYENRIRARKDAFV